MLSGGIIMKTAKAFFERLQSDEAFAQKVNESIQARREAGARNYYETFIPVAAENGYELTKEELDSVIEAVRSEVSEEELGKVAGGTSCIGALISMAITITSMVTATLTAYTLKETLGQ